MRYNENSNLYDIFSKIDKTLFDTHYDAIIEEISKSLTITKVIANSIFKDNKINIDLSLKTRNILIENTLRTISQSIYSISKIDIIFIYIDMGGTPSLITSAKTKFPEKSYFIYVNPTNQKDGTVHFNFVLKIDINDPKKNDIVIKDDILKYIYTNLLNISLDDSDSAVSKEIEYNPNDKNELLNIIEITNNKGTPKTFLLGKGPEYNIYIDDDSTNKLVGRLVFKDRGTLKTDVYWCNDYEF
jgi:hypothetical protein